MVQQGQVFQLTARGSDGERLWAFRYRTGGRDSRRVQRGGFATEQDARDALERELERLRRERRIARRLTLAELVETYLGQHDVQPVTIEKLRYLLSKATAVFGDRKIGELTSQEIAEWRMNVSPGYRFEATQALRQVLHRAVAWGMLDVNPAKIGVDNPVRRRKEQHPFESWAELEALARAIGPHREERVVYVRRSFTRGELKIPKTEASTRAVPLQARALDALDRIKDGNGSPLLFPGERGSYLDEREEGVDPCGLSPGDAARGPRQSPGLVGSCSAVRPWCDPAVIRRREEAASMRSAASSIPAAIAHSSPAP